MLSCKLTIPSNPGLATSWKPICHGSGASSKTDGPALKPVVRLNKKLKIEVIIRKILKIIVLTVHRLKKFLGYFLKPFPRQSAEQGYNLQKNRIFININSQNG
jgi:hypothetical protein